MIDKLWGGATGHLRCKLLDCNCLYKKIMASPEVLPFERTHVNVCEISVAI